MRAERVAAAMLAVVVGVGAAACSSDSAGSGSGSSSTGSGSADAAPAIAVVDAYTVPGAGSVAIYLTLDNDGGADRIVGAELAGADGELAEHVSLHHVREHDGLTTMEPVDDLPVAAHGRTVLGPGGAHLMVEGLHRPIELGDTVAVRLHFEHHEPLTATATAVDADTALDRREGHTGGHDDDGGGGGDGHDDGHAGDDAGDHEQEDDR